MDLQTYFTFPDGALRYDCQACGQRCCRGKGFALSEGELTPLLRRAPRLSAFLRLRPGGSFFATDLTDGCFFLAGDGNCSLEVQHGRDAKPSTCRLFPFNRVYRAAAVRVIDFNATLCPLQVAAPGTGVRHAELLAEVAALAQAGSPLIDVPLPPPPGLPEDWLAREQEAQAALLTTGGFSALPAAQAEAPARWGRLFGLSAAQTEAALGALAPQVALLSPSLRVGRLFRRGADAYADEARRLPLRLRALALLGALVKEDGAPPSLRGLCELWQGQAEVLDVLARFPEKVRLATPRFSADAPPLLLPATGALLGAAFRASARGGAPLADLVEAAAATLPEGAQRPLVLSLAATQLAELTPA